MSAVSVTSAFPGANREDRTAGFLSPKTVTREALKALAARGAEVRPAMVRKLVTQFIEQGHTTSAHVVDKVIAYADPTGDAATRHLDRTNWATSARERETR
ncbi:MAG: hypothetical protein P1U38_09760 [Aeromicrobium sp.]|uniref:hypothetical protein n=1 Tax=Aeromicrobium sp. TaxID=1871063 RepID=UPI00260DEA4F|nr:hypothetical protein [Aeromicrobium sp.]MDF1705047.1 hypothetical protein [Aeromicrobium sp.]